jgi:hypothetical protein
MQLSTLSAQDIRVSSIKDSHDGASEQFTAGGSKLNLLIHCKQTCPPKSKDFFAGQALKDRA